MEVPRCCIHAGAADANADIGNSAADPTRDASHHQHECVLFWCLLSIWIFLAAPEIVFSESLSWRNGVVGRKRFRVASVDREGSAGVQAAPRMDGRQFSPAALALAICAGFVPSDALLRIAEKRCMVENQQPTFVFINENICGVCLRSPHLFAGGGGDVFQASHPCDLSLHLDRHF